MSSAMEMLYRYYTCNKDVPPRGNSIWRNPVNPKGRNREGLQALFAPHWSVTRSVGMGISILLCWVLTRKGRLGAARQQREMRENLEFSSG